MRKFFLSPPSLRLNTTIVFGVILLLVTSLAVVFYQSRQTLRQEAIQDVKQTLDATILKADNVLMSVEQTTGNFYWDMISHFSDPDQMFTYTREIVKSNPYIYGCAIAYSSKALSEDRDRFLAYTHRKTYDSSELITSDRYSEKSYMEQAWYLDPSETGQIFWMLPKTDRRDDDVPVLLYCIPVRLANQETIAVIAIEVSMDLLTEIVEKAKPSPHSYCMLLDNDGSYIIHPDRSKLLGQTVFSVIEEDADSTMNKTAHAMLSGKTGHQYFRSKGKGYYAFYKPFLLTDKPGRSLYDIKWSISIIYPEEDINSAFWNMFTHVATVSFVGLFLFFLLTRIFIRRQLKPLRKLTSTAEEIAEGNYDEEIDDTRRKDEVGEFQRNFKRMQEALYAKAEEQEQLTATLQERGELLRKTYEQVQEAEQVKKGFLHNMTNQMIEPARAIQKSVDSLCDTHQDMSLEEATQEVYNIRQQRETILGLLNQMFNPSGTEAGKEDSHE